MHFTGLKKLLIPLCLIFSLAWIIELKSATLHLPREIKVRRWQSYPYRERGGHPVFINFKYEGTEYYIPISNIAAIYKQKR